MKESTAMRRRLLNRMAVVGLTMALMAAVPLASRALPAVPQDAAASLSSETLAFATPTVDDMAVLKKAVDKVQKNALLLNSDVRVRMVNTGVIVSINESIKVMGHFPDKFRSEVTMLDEDGKSPATNFLVTSDGANVSTYRASTKEYASQDFSGFKGNFASFLPSVGIVCGIVASGPPWVGDDAPDTPEKVTAFLGELKKIGLTMTAASGTNGQRIFEMRQGTEDATNFRVRFAVEPLSGNFVAAQMSGKEGPWKFTITENIRSLAKISDAAAGSFTFQAPADAKKIDKLSVWPL